MKLLRRHRWTIGFIIGVLVITGGYFALQNEARNRTEALASLGRHARTELEREAHAQSARVAAEGLARDYTVCAQVNELRSSMRRLGILLVDSDGRIDGNDLKVLAIINTELADKPCPPSPRVGP